MKTIIFFGCLLIALAFSVGCTGQAVPSQLDHELLDTSVVDGISQIQLLLDKGANVNARDAKQETLLLLAADHGRLEVVQLLIQRGAEIDTKDEVNRTPLTAAAHNNDADIVKFLLDHGANVNAGVERGETPLFAAITGEPWQERSSILEKTRLLIDRGANIQAGDSKGMTPVRYASQSDSNNDILKLLLERGARPNARDEHGDTALTWAEAAATRLLLDHGADIGTKNNEGTTPLMEAAEFGDTVKIRLLLARGAKLYVRDNKGRTALDYARASHEVHGRKKLQAIHLLTSLGKGV